MKICIACGMPMNDAADYAMGDENKDYCRYCCNPDGSMQSYQQKLQGLDNKTARSAAQSMMAKLTAWKDQTGAPE